MNPRTIYARVGAQADLDSLAKSRQATAAVLHALRDRLTPEEAAQAAAQLPSSLKALWRSGVPASRPVKMHRREFVERVKREAGLRSLHRAELVVDAVFAELKAQLSPGEADDIEAQLPRDLKMVWARA